MKDELDPQRIVAALITDFGDHALAEANERAELMRVFGNLGGMRVWREVARQVEELRTVAARSRGSSRHQA